MADDADEDAHVAALRQRLDAIEAMPGSEAKTKAIRRLAEELQDLYGVATRIRTAEMMRIRDEEALSLAKLADRVGISKARADQLIKADAARRKKERDA